MVAFTGAGLAILVSAAFSKAAVTPSRWPIQRYQYVYCTEDQNNQIKEAIGDALEMAKTATTIDFMKDPAAIDFFGPPTSWMEKIFDAGKEDEIQLMRNNITEVFKQVNSSRRMINVICQKEGERGSYKYGSDCRRRGTVEDIRPPIVNTTDFGMDSVFCTNFFSLPSFKVVKEKMMKDVPVYDKFRLDLWSGNQGMGLICCLQCQIP